MIDRRLALLLALGLVGCEEGAPPDSTATPPIEQPGAGGSGGAPEVIGAGGGGGVVEQPGGAGGEAPGGAGGEAPGAGGAAGEEMPLACADPGRVTLRRLNRAEYDNTVRDLLGDDSRPAQAFPEDDIGYGFDNIGDVLTISPLHLERYELAATELVERAVDAPTVRTEVVFEAEELGSDTGAAFRGEYWNLWSNGSMDAALVFPSAGEYLIRVAAFGHQAGPEPARMTVSLDRQLLETFDVANVDSPEWYEVSVVAPAGGHTVSVAFINDYFEPDNPDRNQRDRNLILDAIIVDGPIGGGAVAAEEQVFEAEEVGADQGAAGGDAWNLWSNGTMSVDLNLPSGGEYDLRVRAWGQQAGPEPARMALSLDGQELRVFDVEATAGAPDWYEHRVAIGAGAHTIGVSFINDFWDPDNPDPAQRDRNLLLDVLIVHGPFNAEAPDGPPEPGAENPLFVCQPADQDDFDCAGQIVAAFTTRAWRRPLKDGELDRLMTLVRLAREHDDPLVEGIRLAMRAALLSPHFLYKVELDPDPHSLEPHRLTEHELATRLSYFLWSTMPDDQLRALADEGRLSDPEVLDAEVQRMLADPKAEALVDNFAGQWLFVRAMTDVAPDYNYFPDFDDLLRGAMIVEALAFFRRFMADDRPVQDLMDFETTFLNPRLAAHYGIDFETGVESPDAPPTFREFDLAGTDRGGVLTLGSTLTVTSFPTRTSPVKRGKWVLEQLMCDEPPAPPPGVEAELGEVDQEGTLRERLAQHRENPECAVCHNRMDPIGLGLENFDAIGAFRDMEGEHPIDSSGELPGSGAFVGARELAEILKDDARFKSCFQDQIVTYALGTGVERREAYACLEAMAEDFDEDEWRMQSVIGRLVQSPMFTMRRGEPEAMEGE